MDAGFKRSGESASALLNIAPVYIINVEDVTFRFKSRNEHAH